ncbi:PREDICTED: vitamin K-dependent protein S-like isoform X2 [Nicotiana attenuata]|uniref:vitamin K-dependent protein S-like isoform X2 n=1 Tax=Nicotiana attenuata TaxID=49451 RepID=UPI0009049703|nr:PREDICTED: vitamin K-dependent protein S-like isoform X2 [Nicotiana attenuata]
MASIHIFAIFSLIFILLPWSTANNALPPIFSPIFENVCKEVSCGKGTCKASSNGTFGFACECDPGWRQTRSKNDNFFKFLPCVIPNSCHWAECGGGMCNKTSPVTYSCECQEGYYNLLNLTAFPCFKECALGMDCSQLGIDIMGNKSSSPPPSLPDNSKSIAISLFGGGYGWSIITAATMAVVLLI